MVNNGYQYVITTLIPGSFTFIKAPDVNGNQSYQFLGLTLMNSNVDTARIIVMVDGQYVHGNFIQGYTSETLFENPECKCYSDLDKYVYTDKTMCKTMALYVVCGQE